MKYFAFFWLICALVTTWKMLDVINVKLDNIIVHQQACP